MLILGVVGPFQLLFLLVIVAIIVTIVLVVVRFSSSKNNPTIIDDIRPTQNSNNDKISSLERLNKLRESGALSEEEFQTEKNRILS